jgi:1-acyl-sn-glycerol-3-phosphate acyltransferase
MSRPDKLSPGIYGAIRVLTRAIMRFKFDLRSLGTEKMPAGGGVIIASNHASFLDPPLIGASMRRRLVRFMARDTLFENKFLGWFYHRLGVVPLSRERGDVAAIKTAIRLLKEGQCVALFPEGTRTLDGHLQNAKGGIGFLISKAGVPVLPCYIDGSYEAWPKGGKKIKSVPITITYGDPIQPAELLLSNDRGKVDFDAIGRLVMERIAGLKDL